MSRTTLKPGDLLMVDPVRSGVLPTPAQVAENGVDLMFAWNPKPWHKQQINGVTGLTAQEAEEVLRGERTFEWAVLYKAWEEETQTPYSPPQSVLDEVERRQMAVQATGEPAENLGKIKPEALDFETPKDGLW